MTSDRTPGGFSPTSLKVTNASSVYEYYAVKSGYEEENKLTKQNHSTALLNTDTEGKLLNLLTKILFYTIYQITSRNITWQHVQEMDKNNGNSCERYTFLY